MLVIARQAGQEVVIGDPKDPLCIVKVISFQGNTAKLGFTAAERLRVNRSEIAARILEDEANPTQTEAR